jgi:hypothetical protein
LGNVKAKDGSGKFLLPRSPSGSVTFLSSWHRANLQFASQILGHHQDQVDKVLWDIAVDSTATGVYRRYFNADGRKRFCLHEAFVPGQVVGVNCVVPATISDEEFWRLMQVAGQYKGLSPWKPGLFGFFEVESIRPRRAVQSDLGGVVEKNRGPDTCQDV